MATHNVDDILNEFKGETGYTGGTNAPTPVPADMGIDYDTTVRPTNAPPPTGRAPRGIYTPPERPQTAAAPTFASPQQQQSDRNMHTVISVDDNGVVQVTFHTEEAVIDIIESVGVENVLRFVPNSDPTLWAGKILILRGGIVVPKQKLTFTLEVAQ